MKPGPKPTIGRCAVEGCDYEGKLLRGWCRFHYGRWHHTGTPDAPKRPNIADRFWSKVAVGEPDECWIWTAGPYGRSYGRFTMAPNHPVPAHRFAYELHYRVPVPTGFDIDHLCKTTRCCNPTHLEVVTHAENNRRSTSPSALNAQRTECVNGHKFTAANTYIHPKRGTRHCRACAAERSARRSS